MCRSIKTLRQANYVPSHDEIEAAALQFVRKISGYRQPSQRNQAAFTRAVDLITGTSAELLVALGSTIET